MSNPKKLDELMYKGIPVIRRGDKIYYGFIEDDYIIEINIKESENSNGLEMTSKAKIALITNQTHLTGKERPVKKAEREGLFDALDLAYVWLDDVLGFEE